MKFYVIDPFDAARTPLDALKGFAFETGPCPRCPKCGGFAGWRDWLPPLKAELELFSREFGDLAMMTPDLLISERFSQIYHAAGLTGLRGFEPVEITKVRRRRKTTGTPPRYFRARPVQSMAAVDGAASECEWDPAPTCDLCRVSARTRWKRIIVEPGTWSGEDIFFPRGAKDFMVSARFKDVCDENDLKTPPLVSAETFGHDFNPWETRPGWVKIGPMSSLKST